MKKCLCISLAICSLTISLVHSMEKEQKDEINKIKPAITSINAPIKKTIMLILQKQKEKFQDTLNTNTKIIQQLNQEVADLNRKIAILTIEKYTEPETYLIKNLQECW